MRVSFIQLTLLFILGAVSARSSEWFLARSPHFEVYSGAGADQARLAAERFEKLRSFFGHTRVFPLGPELPQNWPVLVIAFGSQSEYEAFKIRSMADAYFTGTSDRYYIVMPPRVEHDFAIAAHEYAHFILFSHGLKLPGWLDEGIAELSSTLKIVGLDRCELGGPLPARLDVLRHHSWLKAEDLATAGVSSPLRETREGTSIFYAESWALTDMLTFSPEYASRLGEFVQALAGDGLSSQQAFQKVYGKSMDAVLDQAKRWVAQGRSSSRILPALSPVVSQTEVRSVPPRQVRLLTADLLAANSEWTRSEGIYKAELNRSPKDPDLLGALGGVELRLGNQVQAADYFRRALDENLASVQLCYRYALLADEMNLPPAEIERALERTVALAPTFDDARYKLALLRNNRSDFAGAVKELQAMKAPSGKRAFDYWTMLAYDFSELDNRTDALDATDQAARFAVTPEQRARVSELRYTAQTDLNVRFARDASGNLQLVTTRVPHGTTEFNPFIEPGDQMKTASGRLKEVRCEGGRLTGLVVVQGETRNSLLLSIPDPLHVQIRNGPSQFFCGAQDGIDVTVEYAAARGQSGNLLRGMEFKKLP